MSEIALTAKRGKTFKHSIPQNVKSFNERVLEEVECLVECMCKVLLAENKL